MMIAEAKMRIQTDMVASQVLAAFQVEAAVSHEPPTDILESLLPSLRATRLREHLRDTDAPSRRPHIGAHIGDLVMVDAVMTCVADPDSCNRTLVCYIDGNISKHRNGLQPGVHNLLQQMGVEVVDGACDHHGGISVTAPTEV